MSLPARFETRPNGVCSTALTDFRPPLYRNSIASSNILGILTDAHLTTNQFNNLSTAFYAGYITFVLPHAWMMQRFPIAKWIALNIFFWSIFIGMQCLCKSYGPLCE